MVDSALLPAARDLLIPLKIADFRRLAIGYGASLVGSMFYFIALTWLTLTISGSGLVLGSVLAAVFFSAGAALLLATVLTAGSRALRAA